MTAVQEEVRIEQEELDTIKRSVLTSSRRLLVESLDPANHLSYLRSKFVLTERDAEEITAPASRSARVEVFLDKLSLKGSEAYDELQNSLCRDRTQLFLLTSMTKTLELLKHKVREFKGQQMKQQQELLRRQQQEFQRSQQQKTQPPFHTFYTQTPYHHNHQQPQQKAGFSTTSVPNVSPRTNQQGPTHCAGQRVQQQQAGHYHPTPAQQAQRDAYCQQKLLDRRHAHPSPQQPHNYQSQQSMGFSPPPRYQSHTFTIPQTPPPHTHHQRHTPPLPQTPPPHTHHQRHTPPLPQTPPPHTHHRRHIPPQTPPNFQSRDGPADDNILPANASNSEIDTHPNEYFNQGLPPDSITSSGDMPRGEPCGQPS